MTVQAAETAIRELIATWLRASAAGDSETLSTLMADDVVFLLPGQPPMRGRETFMKSFQSMIQKIRLEATSDIQEIQVVGDWAYCWNHLSVTMTPIEGGPPSRRSGHILTILRREPDGHWVIFRDANLLAADT
ncbi:MAG: SgcJ/EcaC family oxidoreductase [Bryobacterales bacterium]|nr:SgcJ/EcaC family oxidoreductase [Bryobacterales bacterium]